MGRWRLLDLTVISSHIVLVLFSSNLTTTLAQDVCSMVDTLQLCGKGRCEVNSSAIFGYGCKCDSGWKFGHVLNLTIPTCAFPDCGSDDFQCGSPLPPLFPPQLIPDPVCMVLCLGGNCTSNGFLNVTCHCDQGSANLLNNPHLPCLPECYSGAKCKNDLAPPPPPPPPSPSPTPSSKGSNGVPNYSMNTLDGLIMMLLPTVFLTWF